MPSRQSSSQDPAPTPDVRSGFWRYHYGQRADLSRHFELSLLQCGCGFAHLSLHSLAFSGRASLREHAPCTPTVLFPRNHASTVGRLQASLAPSALYALRYRLPTPQPHIADSKRCCAMTNSAPRHLSRATSASPCIFR